MYLQQALIFAFATAGADCVGELTAALNVELNEKALMYIFREQKELKLNATENPVSRVGI